MEEWINGAKNKRFIASYSGGKDSTLALYKGMEQGEALGIIVMMEEDGKRSRAHSLSPSLLKAQGEALGLRVFTHATSWKDYEKNFIKELEEAKKIGAEVLVTGDIDVPRENCWHENVCNRVNLKLAMPLWRKKHKEIVLEFISLGFICKIVTINLEKGMKKDDLGKILTFDYVKELEERGIDPCGEADEFHTVVLDGPIFNRSLKILKEEIVSDGKYMHLILEVL